MHQQQENSSLRKLNQSLNLYEKPRMILEEYCFTEQAEEEHSFQQIGQIKFKLSPINKSQQQQLNQDKIFLEEVPQEILQLSINNNESVQDLNFSVQDIKIEKQIDIKQNQRSSLKDTRKKNLHTAANSVDIRQQAKIFHQDYQKERQSNSQSSNDIPFYESSKKQEYFQCYMNEIPYSFPKLQDQQKLYLIKEDLLMNRSKEI